MLATLQESLFPCTYTLWCQRGSAETDAFAVVETCLWQSFSLIPGIPRVIWRQHGGARSHSSASMQLAVLPAMPRTCQNRIVLKRVVPSLVPSVNVQLVTTHLFGAMQLAIPPAVPEQPQRPASAGAELRARAAESRAQQAQQAPSIPAPAFPAKQLQPEPQGTSTPLRDVSSHDVRDPFATCCMFACVLQRVGDIY